MSRQTDDRHLLAFCSKLIRTPSYSGEEGAVARLLCEEALALGFDEAGPDEYGNVLCRLSGRAAGRGRTLVFDGHMDTVPANPDNWTRDPFGGQVEGGRIHGRGASDMKGSLAAMLYAVARLADSRDDFCGDIFLCGTVNEEQFEGVALGKILSRIKADLVIIGEASEMALKIGQRGRAEIRLEAIGKAAHSSNPQAGSNAVYTLLDYIKLLRDEIPPRDPFLGEGISVLTDIASQPYPGASVVPYHCVATVDRRLLPGENRQSVLDRYEGLADVLRERDPEAELEISIASGSENTYTGARIESDRFFPAWKMEEDDPLVALALEAVGRAGLEPRISKYSFCTNGSMSAGEMGIPTLGFGPGREDLAHVDDEYLEVRELYQACRVFTELGQVFFKKL